MIGLALHLGACALDRVVAEVEEARRVLDWCLAFTAPSLEEQVERLAAEVDALRAERDAARARVAEETALAVSICWDLEACAADLEALRAAVRRHLAADTLGQAEPAWRALEALLPEVKP